MGCCISSAAHAGRNSQLGSEKPGKIDHSNRFPPPPSIEEETVKEVLSETPNFTKPPIPPPPVEEEKLSKTENTHIDPAPFCAGEKVKFGFKEEETENSEVCSLSVSETVSVSTTTFDHGGNDDGAEGEVKQRVRRSPAAKLPARNRPISGDFGQRRDRVAGKSPNRRSEQSPGRRNVGRGGGGTVKLVQARELSTARGLRSDPYRKEPGQGSERRSKSPATSRSQMGRSPSARRVNGSPGRVRADPPGSKRPESANTGQTPNESLENPLVSLECFIFL